MRSTIAGLAGILYFMLARTIAVALFPDALAGRGLGRDIISTVVLGGSLLTFVLVYWFYWRLRRLAFGRPRSKRHRSPNVVRFPRRGRRGSRY